MLAIPHIILQIINVQLVQSTMLIVCYAIQSIAPNAILQITYLYHLIVLHAPHTQVIVSLVITLLVKHAILIFILIHWELKLLKISVSLAVNLTKIVQHATV
jgi:hypothetical protein